MASKKLIFSYLAAVLVYGTFHLQLKEKKVLYPNPYDEKQKRRCQAKIFFNSQVKKFNITLGKVLYAYSFFLNTDSRIWCQAKFFIHKPPLIKSFCRGSRGAVFSKRAPLAAGGKIKTVFFVWRGSRSLSCLRCESLPSPSFLVLRQ